MIHNTVCGLLLRESKIYREIEVVNMWWTTIIVVALLAFGIVGFVSMVRLFEQRLTSETTRRAEDMYDLYADSPRKRHRRSLASRRCCPVVRCPALNPVTGSRSTAGFHRPAGVMTQSARPQALRRSSDEPHRSGWSDVDKRPSSRPRRALAEMRELRPHAYALTCISLPAAAIASLASVMRSWPTTR